MFNLKDLFSPAKMKQHFANVMYNDRAVLYTRVMEKQYFKGYNFLNICRDDLKTMKTVTVNKEMFLNTNYVLLDSLKCIKNTKLVMIIAQDWSFLNGTRYLSKIDLDRHTRIIQVFDSYIPSLMNLLEVPNIISVVLTEDSVGTIKEEWLALKNETPQCNLMRQ